MRVGQRLIFGVADGDAVEVGSSGTVYVGPRVGATVLVMVGVGVAVRVGEDVATGGVAVRVGTEVAVRVGVGTAVAGSVGLGTSTPHTTTGCIGSDDEKSPIHQ